MHFIYKRKYAQDLPLLTGTKIVAYFFIAETIEILDFFIIIKFTINNKKFNDILYFLSYTFCMK